MDSHQRLRQDDQGRRGASGRRRPGGTCSATPPCVAFSRCSSAWTAAAPLPLAAMAARRSGGQGSKGRGRK